MAESRRPHRTAVTHPRTIAVRRPGHITKPPAIEEIIQLGPVELLAIESLMRAQLRLSLRFLVGTASILLSVPLLLARVSWFSTTYFAQVPVCWLVIGLGFFPVFVMIGVRYTKAVEQLEQRFRVVSEKS